MNVDNTRLEGKTCVVTGGGQGLGLAIAQRFAAEGANIALIERNPSVGTEAAAHIEGIGVEVLLVEADVSEEKSVISARDLVVERFGAVDVLVNNAGIGGLGPSLEFELADFRRSLDVMVLGVFLCSREFGTVMRQHGEGSIVNISSINGIVAFPMRLAYSASKAAVISMTRVLAVEWARYGIRVNAVAPGNTHTAMLQEAIDQGLIDVDVYKERTPLGRLAVPSDIANAVFYLSTDESSYVTGQVLAVDGGWTSFGWVPWNWDPEEPILGAPGLLAAKEGSAGK